MKSDFKIGDRVKIIELERPGVVRAILTDRYGVTYLTRYFWDGAAKEVYFYADELEKRK